MALIKEKLKSYVDKGNYKIVVFGDKEYVAFDAKLKEFEGKEVELDTWSKNDKHYCGFPKAGGFQGKSGGGWKGKSDKELYLQALTMSMAYAKDVVVASYDEEKTSGDQLIPLYKKISKAILDDLKAIESSTSQESPKPAEKPPVTAHKSAENEDLPKTTIGEMTIKQKLEHEMHNYLKSMGSDTKENFRTLLMDISGFPGKDRDTGELTGKMVCVEDIDDKKFSDKWALSSYGKLKKLRDEQEVQEHYSTGKEDDIPY